SDNFGSNPGRVFTKSTSLARESRVGQLRNRRAAPDKQSARQFGCRQPIPVDPEVFDDQHKVDLRQLNTDWTRYWSEYMEMWEDRYEYLPTQEPIIVSELSCVPEYMPWFRIHGKPYLLTPEER
ncbi:hypothetical protein Gotur_032505, partial [Gossypium turneri]